MPGHDIITIGASAGGVEALRTLVHELPADIPAAIFVVLHIPPEAPSLLPQILSRSGPLRAVQPQGGEHIRHGIIYVAPPDCHLMIDKGDIIRLVRGPRENRHRPAVDPLFRSAAVACGPRVVGVVLTGALDDGTAGLLAIKERGGIAVVQDPQEALYSDMPLSAIEHVPVDYVLPLDRIAPVLEKLAHTPVIGGGVPVSKEMEMETRIMQMDPEFIEKTERPGVPSIFTCPECKGVLYEIRDKDMVRYRCRTGHAFAPESMLADKSLELENALYAALNTLEESIALSRRMERHAQQRSNQALARRFGQKVEEAEQRAATIRKVLLDAKPLPHAVPDEIDPSPIIAGD